MKQKDILFYSCLGILSIVVFFWLIAPLFYDDAWKGGFQMTNPDSLLFARELEQSILKGRILDTDNYAAFPYDTKTGFAPFYMYFLVTFVNLVFFLFPKLSIDPVYIAAILPIVIPWLTSIFLVFSIYKLTNNKILALFCALGMLPDYSTMMVSGYFNLDYDYLISLYIWIWLILWAFYIKNGKDRYILFGGLVTAFFISTWTGSPFFYFFATLYCFIIWLKSPKSNLDNLTYVSNTMLIGSVVALIFVPRNEDTLRYFLQGNVGRYSYLQGILVFLGAVFLLILKRLSNCSNSLKIHLNLTLQKGANSNKNSIFVANYPRVVALSFLVLLSLVIVIIFHENLLQATGILFQKDPIHANISELEYGISLNNMHKEGLKDLIFKFGPFLLFFHFCLIFKSKINQKKETKLLIHWLFIFIILTIFYQIRYIRWMGVGYEFLIGFSIWTLWNLIVLNQQIIVKKDSNNINKYHDEYVIGQNKTKEGENKNYLVSNICSFFKVSMAILPILLVSIISKYSCISASFYKFNKEEVELFNYIIENTPKTSGYEDDNKPEYGILAYWDRGNKISYYTKRPVAVSNSLWGYKTMADIFSSEKESVAFNLCKKYKMKFTILEPSKPIKNDILSYWQLFKSMPESPEYKLYYGDVPQKDTFDYYYFWLKDHLGLTKLGNFDTTNHFRVVFANKNDGSTISKYLLFECVDGAICEFKIEPKTNVSLSIEFKLSELSFIYKINKITDENGICKIILPYSNGYNKGNVITDPFYKLSFEKDGKKILAKLTITDEDVVQGKAVDMEKQLEYLNN